MNYIHRKCGGSIDTTKRVCAKCGKKWDRVSIWTDSTNIRLSPHGSPSSAVGSKIIGTGQTSYAKWGNKVPVVWWVASRLPNWPRWARILSVLIVYGGSLALLISFFRWTC